jgi:hypothetical protein
MSFGNYFRRALLLPLLVGGISTVLAWSGGDSLLLAILAGSLIIGGIPYLFFLLAVCRWSLRRSAEDIRKAYWKIPLLYPLFLMPMVVIGTYLVEGDVTLLDAIGAVFFLFYPALLFAYVYAILIYGGWRLLEKCCPARSDS